MKSEINEDSKPACTSTINDFFRGCLPKRYIFVFTIFFLRRPFEMDKLWRKDRHTERKGVWLCI
jgi:hypothetical protein